VGWRSAGRLPRLSLLLSGMASASRRRTPAAFQSNPSGQTVPASHSALELDTREDRCLQARPLQARPLQARIRQARVLQARILQVRFLQTRPLQGRPFQVCP
jgi:hypothetical protein